MCAAAVPLSAAVGIRAELGWGFLSPQAPMFLVIGTLALQALNPGLSQAFSGMQGLGTSKIGSSGEAAAWQLCRYFKYNF